MHLKKGNQVKILSGKDKGKTGQNYQQKLPNILQTNSVSLIVSAKQNFRNEGLPKL